MHSELNDLQKKLKHIIKVKGGLYVATGLFKKDGKHEQTGF